MTSIPIHSDERCPICGPDPCEESGSISGAVSAASIGSSGPTKGPKRQEIDTDYKRIAEKLVEVEGTLSWCLHRHQNDHHKRELLEGDIATVRAAAAALLNGAPSHR